MNEEYEYLEYVNNLSELSLENEPSLYGLSIQREKLHMALLKKHGLENYYDKSKEIFEHLDYAIGIKFPLHKTERIKPIADELERILSCAELQYYLHGKTIRMNTNFGCLTNGKWTNK